MSEEILFKFLTRVKQLGGTLTQDEEEFCGRYSSGNGKTFRTKTTSHT